MELLNTHPIKKSDLGFHGNLFGGKILAWVDSAASGLAMQLCDSPRLVTVSLDECRFIKPGKEGQLLKIPISDRAKNRINQIIQGIEITDKTI